MCRVHVQAAACDSMTLLMKKLDHLIDSTQEVHSADPAHTGRASADEEAQSAAVSQVHLYPLQSGLFIWCCTQARPKELQQEQSL